MKRTGNLYASIYEIENIRAAHAKAQRGKRHYTEVLMVNADPDRYFSEIHDMLKNRTFQNAPYKRFTRVERGKEREIFKLPYYPDRIVHHCAMNVLEPIWAKTFIRDTYASMPGRGVHDGMRRMQAFLEDVEGTRYCLKLDVRKFYPSIDHDILKQIIRKSIKCPGTLWLLDQVIDSAPGVPIGNYLSQYFANLYLAYFDHWAKEILGARYYQRYCDDIVILHKDKSVLHGWIRQIQAYLGRELTLTVKPNWQVFPTRTRGVDFLGYRFFGTHTLVRRGIADAFKRKMARIRRSGRRMAPSKVINTTMSYHGWLKHADARHLWVSQMDGRIRAAVADMCRRQGVSNPLYARS